jgi:gamma-aminobutyric acid receptor subunit alpha
MDAYFRQTWEDKRLSFDGKHEGMESIAMNIKFLEKIWKPDTFFYNGHGSYLHSITSPNKLLRMMKNGTLLYSMR